MLRQDAIKSLTSFIESGALDRSQKDVRAGISSILLLVKENTRGYQETNVNIMKAIMFLFVAVCEFHEGNEFQLSEWIIKDATEAAVQKISDRKLSVGSRELLTALCVVSSPATVILVGIEALKGVKSPIAHEEFMNWCQIFCNDFGATAIGSRMSEMIPWLLDVSLFCLVHYDS